MVQGNGLRLGVADIAGGRRFGGLHHRYLRPVRRLALALQDRAGVGIDLVLELLTGLAPDLHLIVGGGLVQLRIDFAVRHLRGGCLAERCRGDVHGLVRADGHGGCARFGQILQLLHRELCQRVKLQRRIDGEDAVHQRRLTGGNAVFPRLLLQPCVLCKRLRQNGCLCFAGLQNAVHGARQLPLELFRPRRVVVLHRDHDGGGNAVQIAVPHQTAHNGVHRHVQLRTLQVCTAAHIRKDGLRILVERCADQHLFALADLQLDAGVYVQRHHGRHRVCLLIEYPSAAQQHQRKAGRRQRRPPFLCRFLRRHGDHRSFPLITAGENAVHVVWRGLFHRRSQTLLYLFIGHRASSPSRQLRIFFNAL